LPLRSQFRLIVVWTTSAVLQITSPSETTKVKWHRKSLATSAEIGCWGDMYTAFIIGLFL